MNDEPIRTMDPLWERQEAAWQGMLDTFNSISQQINPPPQSRADRVQEVINEIANAVTDPNADSALPERIIANFQALPPGVRGDRNQLRNYLLNNPDAGEFLRDVTNHINRRVPPAFAATVTDPEAVDPDALLVQALGVPVPLGHNIVAPDPAAFQHEMIPAVPPEAAPVMPRDQQLELIAHAAEAADSREAADEAQAALVAPQQAAPDVLAARSTGEFDPGLGMGRERNLRVVDAQGNPVGDAEQQRTRQRMIDDGFPVGGSRREQMAWHRAAPQRAAARQAREAAAAQRTDAPADDDAYESE
jgi:hypothetical protein